MVVIVRWLKRPDTDECARVTWSKPCTAGVEPGDEMVASFFKQNRAHGDRARLSRLDNHVADQVMGDKDVALGC